jgi:transposase
MVPIQRTERIASLRRVIKKSSDPAQKTRIRAIISIKEGTPRKSVATEYVISPTTLISWVVAYNKGGTDALIFSKGGRPLGNPKWSDDIFSTLAKEIDKGGYWSVPRMQEWLKKEYRKDIPEQTVWYRMDQLNYSYKSARPHPVQGNKERQETFKKGASPRSWSRS